MLEENEGIINKTGSLKFRQCLLYYIHRMLKANLIRKLPTKSPYIVNVYTCRVQQVKGGGSKMEGRNVVAGSF